MKNSEEKKDLSFFKPNDFIFSSILKFLIFYPIAASLIFTTILSSIVIFLSVTLIQVDCNCHYSGIILIDLICTIVPIVLVLNLTEFGKNYLNTSYTYGYGTYYQDLYKQANKTDEADEK